MNSVLKVPEENQFLKVISHFDKIQETKKTNNKYHKEIKKKKKIYFLNYYRISYD